MTVCVPDDDVWPVPAARVQRGGGEEEEGRGREEGQEGRDGRHAGAHLHRPPDGQSALCTVQRTLLYCTVDTAILYSGHCYTVQWTIIYCTVDTAILYTVHCTGYSGHYFTLRWILLYCTVDTQHNIHFLYILDQYIGIKLYHGAATHMMLPRESIG